VFDVFDDCDYLDVSDVSDDCVSELNDESTQCQSVPILTSFVENTFNLAVGRHVECHSRIFNSSRSVFLGEHISFVQSVETSLFETTLSVV